MVKAPKTKYSDLELDQRLGLLMKKVDRKKKVSQSVVFKKLLSSKTPSTSVK